MENILVPFQATPHISCTQALVFAPHPDDEVFGCGGAIMRHIEHNTPVQVIILTDGSYGVSDENMAEYISQRQQESIAAALIMGYGTPRFWHYPDRQIEYGEKLIQEILAAIRESGADLIYAPSIFEMHPDHRAVGMAVLEAVRRIATTLRAALYEIGIPLHPNQLLDISSLVERKARAMECFVSQNTRQRYDQHIAALNRFRTYTLPADVTAAEAYLLVSTEELTLDPLKLYQSEHARQTELGLALDRSDIPLVSIIIRSMDRDTLSDALDSIALQTYSHIEVVVVNAKGDAHRDLGEWCGRFPLRMVDHQAHLGRSRAANIGLQEARGDYLIFLDDDDWIEADHIDALTQAIKNHPEVKLVYSGAKCVDEHKNPLPTKFSSSFDRTQLLAGNYIVIHAALFARELLDLGCRVDETLDLYEDWDFWIQLSMHTDFLFVDKLSAVYRITQRTGFGVNADPRIVEQASLVLFKKWLPRLREDELTKLMTRIHLNLAKDHHIRDQQLYIQAKEQQLTTLEQHIHDQNQRLLSQEQQINDQQRLITTQAQEITSQHQQFIKQSKILQEVLMSNSWKITRPLRGLVLTIRWIRTLAQKVSATLKYHGSFIGLISRILAIVKQEGIKSLAYRMMRFFSWQQSLQNDGDTYQEWTRRYDTLSDASRSQLQARLKKFAQKPLISLVAAIHNPNPEWLKTWIEAVQKQIYPHWELCIADNDSTDGSIRSLLEEYTRHDARIKIIWHSNKINTASAVNSALDIAQGEWIGLFDPDSLISEDALFWILDVLNKKQDIALIYSDEDQLDVQGKRTTPYFKCDWNQELFYSHHFFAHLGIFRADLLREIGGFRAEFEAAADYDLALRFIERISAAQIHHIPRILYHVRAPSHPTGTSTIDSDVQMAGLRALNEHFQRRGILATAESNGAYYRVRYALPNDQPSVTLIIPTRNGVQLLRQCITSIIEKTTYQNYDILIVDNNSDDAATLQYFSELEEKGHARILRDSRPFNYSALNNNAVRHARGEFVGLLNNDVEVITPDWLSEMLAIAAQPGVGAVGARLWYPDDTLQHGGVILGLGGIAAHSHKHLPRQKADQSVRVSCTQNLSAVTAACLLVRKSIYEQVGGLEEQNLQVAFNDVDFCLRLLEAGYRNVWTPHAELYHHESATRGYENTPEKMARFRTEIEYIKQRWSHLLFNDPAYNPNLTLDREDFSLADPPRREILN
ncbi:glycosyltransferase [Nitrosomonas sp. JL21]|uniref:glycosyltransferase n=1 Tax=Nitrosomonas sp. JL21 TaxID=153949 RepID=UPI00136EDA2A|nr:glycosyltransferase [Nitrosomonas sp. JL21]MBL8498586.1 glycosyltransferase [Nitrosomonas sp.]MXS78980.1 glycosyltransferase [Nitrosomonas sp. JL21]